jgi:hypothetical protein
VRAHSAASAGLMQIAHEAKACMPRRYSRVVADLDERLEAAEDALLDLAADCLASGNDPRGGRARTRCTASGFTFATRSRFSLPCTARRQRKWLSRRSSKRPRARSGRVVMRAG